MANHWLKLLLCLVVVMNSHRVHGTVQEIGGLNCYVSGPNDSKTAVVLASDVFGYEVPHLRYQLCTQSYEYHIHLPGLIADKLGAAGFYGVVPDYFHGDPFVPGQTWQPWFEKHQPGKGIEDAKPLIKALKNKGITKIGAAGFCWGGKVTVDLTTSPNLIQAAVLLHPTFVTVDDIRGVKVPISILGGQNDTLVPISLLKQFETALKENRKIDSSLKIFPEAQHGWTTQYNETDMAAVKRAEEAHKDLLNWFVKYLK